MALNRIQKKMLREDGFLISEIRAFSGATGGNIGAGDSERHIVKQDVTFNSKPFLAMRKSRRRYIKDLKQLGWTDMEIKTKLVEYYRKGSGRSPFDWLKLEYQPARKLTDFQDSIRRKIRSRVSRTLGKLYGRNLKTATKVRTAPRRPVVPNKPKLIRRIRRTR
ncbi:MAG: hypothetical protein WC516_07990 [Patescibacteria group bacterium]|jgi:hypothetical protein